MKSANVIFIIVIIIALAVLAGCGANRISIDMTEPDTLESSKLTADYAEGEELFCTCSTREEAGSIAERYGIQLVNYENNVAVFHTEEEPLAVIQRGVEQGWPQLELNREVSINN